MLWSLAYESGEAKEIVISGRGDDTGTDSFYNILRSRYMPFCTAVRIDPDSEDMQDISPEYREFKPVDSKPTAWVCSGFTCSRPVTDPAEFGELLK
jgi:uncharacterized protein YyaL (SSP411 family)